MPLETLDSFSSKVADLPDKPNTQMTAAELKSQFDAAPDEVRQKLNENVNVLKSTTAGDSGAENIGSANISGVTGNTVHSQIKNVFNQMQQVVLGQIPNKSITREKFADGAVDFSPVQKEIANLNLQLEASRLVPSGKTYGWDASNSFGMMVDFSKGQVNVQLNAGDTDLEGKVTMAQGQFIAGQRVTVLGRDPVTNEVVREKATITSMSPFAVSPLVNSYKSGAWIKRTTASNTVRGLIFGGLDESETNTITDATVVGQAYDTSGNGGRKLVRLDNGVIVAFVKLINGYKIYTSIDNGISFVERYSDTSYSSLQDISVVSFSNRFYYVKSIENTNVQYRANLVNVDGTISYISDGNIGALQSALGNVSLAINETGTELHATWASKNSTYPNSFNIRYAKGTINADGNVTWGAVEQVTKLNHTSYEFINPSILLDENGVPTISVQTKFVPTSATGFTNNYGISLLKRNRSLVFTGAEVDTNWSIGKVYDSGGTIYIQASPSAIFVPQEINGLTNGRIWVAWHGKDSTDTTANNIRVSYSDDGGATWSAMQKLTSGNINFRQHASITVNKNNTVYVCFENMNEATLEKISFTTSWSSISVVKDLGSSKNLYPSTLFDNTFSLDFSEPLLIYYNNVDNKVGFYGTWTVGSETPILENEIRFTLTQQAKEVMAYTLHDEGLTVNSLVNGQTMDKVTTTTESQFTKVLSDTQYVEIELSLTRPSINDDWAIEKILGGVA